MSAFCDKAVDLVVTREYDRVGTLSVRAAEPLWIGAAIDLPAPALPGLSGRVLAEAGELSRSGVMTVALGLDCPLLGGAAAVLLGGVITAR